MVPWENVLSVALCCHLVCTLGMTPSCRPAGKVVSCRELPTNAEWNGTWSWTLLLSYKQTS